MYAHVHNIDVFEIYVLMILVFILYFSRFIQC